MQIRVVVPEDNVKLTIPVPLFMMNRLTCKYLVKYTNKKSQDFKISAEQLYKLIKCLKESKKTLGHYDLVNVESNDGTYIQIRM